MGTDPEEVLDVIVVGAGLGGIYATHKLRELEFRTACFEAASGVGGVWLHNSYPGARVDVESIDYCYMFDEDLYRSWQWSERFATQPEILAYLNHVVDYFGLREAIKLEHRVVNAQWDPDAARYDVMTSDGVIHKSRFLVMATGNLSEPRRPDFAGLDSFQGECHLTSAWPSEPVQFESRRVGVVGTGSSGVQVVTALAPVAEQLFVFQRSPNYSVPARNVKRDDRLSALADQGVTVREALWELPNPVRALHPGKRFEEYTESERVSRLERQWASGAHEMAVVFADQATDPAVNAVVANFVRSKIHETVTDQRVAAALSPTDHPIGSRRLIIDTGYYESFNRENVHLVDLRTEPLLQFTRSGLATVTREYELDAVVLALGFNAFSGSLLGAQVRNQRGDILAADWADGPRTFFGIMSDRFPNLFFLTGPGSPSVLSNLFAMNELHVEWVTALLDAMRRDGHRSVVPMTRAVDDWGCEVQEAARGLLRLDVSNYMVRVTRSGERVFMPWAAGFHSYRDRLLAMTAAHYAGLSFD